MECCVGFASFDVISGWRAYTFSACAWKLLYNTEDIIEYLNRCCVLIQAGMDDHGDWTTVRQGAKGWFTRREGNHRNSNWLLSNPTETSLITW